MQFMYKFLLKLYLFIFLIIAYPIKKKKVKNI